MHKDQISVAKQTGDYIRKSMVPVKAAPKDANCSQFVDPETLAFLKVMMKGGNKHTMIIQLNKIFENIKEIQLKKYYKANPERREGIIVDPQQILVKAVDNARPLMSIQKVKRGSVTYSVPTPITLERSLFEARRWIIQAALDRDKHETRLADVLPIILIETANGSGRVIATRNEHHKTCEQNRAYANLRPGR